MGVHGSQVLNLCMLYIIRGEVDLHRRAQDELKCHRIEQRGRWSERRGVVRVERAA